MALSWQRTTWHLHSAIGIWTFAFTLTFGLSGAYHRARERQAARDGHAATPLSCTRPPDHHICRDQHERANRAEPESALRITDQVIYWLAYLHFGRINGIGIPCSGPPAVMFVTGAIMWWNRVLRPRRPSPAATV